MLLSVSDLLTSFGRKLLASTTSIEMFLQFRIDELPRNGERQFMFCFAARGAQSSWSLGVMPDGKLFFDLRGFGGREFSQVSNETIRLGSVLNIRAFHRLNEDLCSEIALLSDDGQRKEAVLKLSFPVIFHSKSLVSYLNWNPYSQRAQDFSFYAGKMLWVNKGLEDTEAETILKWMALNTCPSKMIKLESGAFGKKPQASEAMIFDGKVTSVEVQ